MTDVIVKVTACIAFLTAIFTVLPHLTRGATALVDISRSLKTLILIAPDIKQTARLAPLVPVLEKEFRPNGGSSMKDNITATLELAKAAQADAAEAKKEAAYAKHETVALAKVTQEQNKVLDSIRASVEKVAKP